MEVCLINRNYPPEKGASGYFAQQLVEFLEAQEGINTIVVSIGTSMEQKKISIHGFYNGKNKALRLISSFWESYRLIKKARQLKSDHYIVMTDPAFLNFWASIFFKKRIWSLWMMDLYPEAFAASKLSNARNVLYRLFISVLQKHQPNLVISLGDYQGNFVKSIRYSDCPVVSSVVGIRDSVKEETISTESPPSWYDPAKITFAYVGNLGEAHNEEALAFLAENLDKKNHQLILCCRGKKAMSLNKRLQLHSAVIILDKFEDEHFAYTDIQVVTLLSDWTHICVPSKSLTAVQFGNAVVFIGDKESDSWKYIEKAAWNMSSYNDILSFLSSIDRRIVHEKKIIASDVGAMLRNKRDQCFEKIFGSIQKVTDRSNNL